MQKSIVRYMLVLAVVLLAVGAISAQDSDVSVQFGWVHTMEYSGFYMAEDEGLYADAGLNVELVSGGFDEDGNFIFPIDRVVSGEADFGVVSGDQLLVARSNGEPVVAIAALYQRSPVVLMSLAESGIVQPEDLIGKTMSIDPQSATGLSVFAMLDFLDINPEDIDIRDRTDFSNEPLISGAVDVLDGFVSNQPVALELDGHDLNLIFPSDYAIDVYTNVIFTTEEMIAEQPELIETFLRATLDGYQAAIDDPEHAAELGLAYNDTLSLEAETEGMFRSLPLLSPVGSSPGLMEPDTWEFAYEILADAELLAGELDVTEAYTMEFLDSIYSD